ncbi:MAG: hypothetical protein WBQ86_00340 [Candidatus Binatus sp.]
MPKAVICIATSEKQAAHLASQLKEAGLSDNDVSVLRPDRAGSRDFAHDLHSSKAPEGAATGAIAGGVTAGILGWLFGIGTAAIPGVGPVMAVLGGAAAGSAVGGIAGAVVGFGIPEDEATLYEGKVESGDALISVHAEGRQEHHAAAPYCEWCRNARRRKSLMAHTPAKPRTLARSASGNLRMRTT